MDLEKIVSEFDFKIINKVSDFKKIKIENVTISSGAYEFLGIIKERSKKQTIICLGSSETNAFLKMSNKQLEEGIQNWALLGLNIILISKTFKLLTKIKKMLIKNNINVLSTNLRKQEVHSIVSPYLVRHLVKKETIHASLVNIYGKGVLIKGEPGIGKSEVTLDLIKRGHFFVADDGVEAYPFASELIGQSVELIKKHLEIRGIGIVNVEKMYGVHTVIDQTKIDIIIKLTKDSIDINNKDRLKTKETFMTITGIKVPYISLNLKSSKNISHLIEAAVLNEKLKDSGFNVTHEFIKEYDKKLVK